MKKFIFCLIALFLFEYGYGDPFKKSVKITVDQEDAKIFVDNEFVALGTYIATFKKKEGHIRVRVEKEGSCMVKDGMLTIAYFLEFKQGVIVRQEYDLIKKTKDKIFSLEARKSGNNILFVVNGEETLDMEQVEVTSSKIGLYVFGKAEVSFDNLKIMQ